AAPEPRSRPARAATPCAGLRSGSAANATGERGFWSKARPVELELAHASPEGMRVYPQEVRSAVRAFDTPRRREERPLDVAGHGLIERQDEALFDLDRTPRRAVFCGRCRTPRAQHALDLYA